MSDASGETAASTSLITVTPPLAVTSFTASTNPISAGQSVLFTNTTSGGTGSNVYAYAENNTAGVTQQGNKLTFADAGKYSITLMVSDASGETATSKALIITVAQPTPLGCNNGNGGSAVVIVGSSKTSVIQITNQDAVQITGSSNNVTIKHAWQQLPHSGTVDRKLKQINMSTTA